ncbi:MAG: HAMP domain-containing sensor histidine kinase [Planctomycetota bacterium]
MKLIRRSWWIVYALCAVAISAALVWVTGTVLALERAEIDARAESESQGRLRLALWRLDSWVLPILAREAARPYSEYFAYWQAPQGNPPFPSGKGEVGVILRPSPLLTARSKYVRLHFQFDASGALSSPQVPEGKFLDLALETCLPAEAVPPQRAALERVAALVQVAATRARVAALEARETDRLGEEVTLGPLPQVALGQSAFQTEQLDLNRKEMQQRAKTSWAARNAQSLEDQVAVQTREGVSEDRGVVVGPLVPLWLGGSPPELFFFRRVQVGTEELLQGIHLDWPGFEAALLAEVEDLVPGAILEPLYEERARAEAAGLTLASIPLALRVPRAAQGAPPSWTPARVTVAIAWLAVLGATLAAGVTLRSSINFGEKRSRFASAVTHELRSPLTTFRIYSEMLAEGMVEDAPRQQLYLDTLKNESGRLATLVENVLSYARLEDGRATTRKERITAGALLERVVPMLERRAGDAGMQLVVEAGSAHDAPLDVDVDAVGQILFNLVDNACKYAKSGTLGSIDIRAALHGGSLELRVRDHGPGVPRAVVRKIFTPFERAAHEGDAAPGIGLGLALGRQLARELGGQLTLEPCDEGACFKLSLRVTRA